MRRSMSLDAFSRFCVMESISSRNKTHGAFDCKVNHHRGHSKDNAKHDRGCFAFFFL